MESLPLLLGLAVLLPLMSFTAIFLFGPRMGKAGVLAGWVATGAIGGAFLLSCSAMGIWLTNHFPQPSAHGHGHASHDSDHGAHDAGHGTHGESTHEDGTHEDGTHDDHHDAVDPHGATRAAESGEFLVAAQHAEDVHDADGEAHAQEAGHGGVPVAVTGNWYTLGTFGRLQLTIGYYIDSLTVAMFCMVTLIATCIHFYAQGYMHDELHDITDHEVTLSDGTHLTRPGRYYRFFQYLSLFCFSMLGLVVSGNIAMTFVFWELVGICSYFLIGFYIERKSASNAANKAFIVNRVGDFGMIIGLMALWSSLGTFNFGDIDGQPGLFQQVRPAGVVAETGGAESHGASHSLIVPDAMVVEAAKGEIAAAGDADYAATVDSNLAAWRDPESSGKKGGLGYGLLVVAGIGIFCGCVGKSAQFPLHVWLPDAMEGPTPVSALVHSATMVAAGVYLVGRFYPVFAPEVLLVIAVVGCITLFMAATIAITATDIKRVLAYSTVSQLGYMMLALGVGGWLAGIMHLFTHAFFKSLLFMCSGSVIHAVHTNEMPLMGGLRKKMPWTAYTMLIGCLAIAGAGVPFLVGFSGYYSKDAILEQAFLFKGTAGNSGFAAIFFFAAAGGAAITAFYMFRLWYMTFAGEPRDQARYDHAHESPPVMYVPLVVLAVMAVGAAWGMNSVFTQLSDAIVGGVIALLVIGGVWAYGRATGNADQEHGSAEASRGASHHGDGHHGRSGHGHEEHGHQSQGHGSHGHDAHGHDAHDGHGHHHAAEPSLKVPAILAGLVVVAGFVWLLFPGLSLANLLEQSRPAGILQAQTGRIIEWTWPNEHDSHAPDIKFWATCTATATAWGGFLLATVLYGWRVLDPQDVRRTFAPVYKFLVNKWWFDELYEVLFVRPTHWVAGIASAFDRKWIDGFINGLAWSVRAFATFWDRIADRTIIDGFVNTVAGWTYQAGLSLRSVQTGKLRQYVTFIVVGTVIVFALASFFWSSALGS